MPWAPGDPWPGTPGGASSPNWSPYIRLWVLAAIGSGVTFHIGQHADDELDSGNVIGGTGVIPAPAGQLWVDLSCDITALEISGGASTSQGVLSKPDAATLTCDIADPTGVFDPLNPNSPYAYGGESRLIPGAPVQAFAEVVDPGTATVSKHMLFTGTADSWGEDWTVSGNDRVAQLVATDATKLFARMDRPEQPAAGAGDTTQQRVQRIVDYFGWTGTVQPGTGTVTLAATTLAQSGWELLNRTLDDELGYIYLTAAGVLRWVGRGAWSVIGPPAVQLGCGTGHDILIDVAPTSMDRQMRNAVTAARPGGVTQAATSAVSIEKYGRYEYSRTDLGLADDTQVGAWATDLVVLYAYPQVGLASVTMRPDVATQPWLAWTDLLKIVLVSDITRIVWSPPDLQPGYTIESVSRVVGYTHRVTRDMWEVRWQLVQTRPMATAGVIFTIGPHANDRLDSNFVLAA